MALITVDAEWIGKLRIRLMARQAMPTSYYVETRHDAALNMVAISKPTWSLDQAQRQFLRVITSMREKEEAA